MPTVVDALVVELSLDAHKLNESTREALEKFKTSQESFRKLGNEVETQGKKVVEFFTGLKRAALGVTGVLLGGMGIQEFTSFLSNLDAANARVAKTMDISARELSNWQGAAEQLGGTAEGITGTLQGLSSEMNKFSLTGQTNLLGPLTQPGVGLYKANGQMKTSTELVLDLADAVQGMDPAKARAFLSMIGADQGTINLMINGRSALQGLLDTADKVGGTSAESARAAQEFQQSLALLERQGEETGRTILTSLTPALVGLLKQFQELAKGPPEGEGWFSFLNRKLDPGPNPIVEWLNQGPYNSPRQAWESLKDKFRGPATFEDRFRAGGGAVPVKPGAGAASPQVRTALSALAGMPGIKEVTSMNDPFHQAFGGAHTQGMALDVTVTDPSKSEAVAAQIRAVLSANGINANVMNEYLNPSAHATGGHLHIGLGAPSVHRAPLPPIGAGAGAAGRQSSINSRSDTKTSTVSIDTGDIHIHTAATDASGISSDIIDQLKRQAAIASWNTGLA